MRTLFTLFLSVIILSTFAQGKKQSAFTVGYTHQLPFGNLSDRFGDNSSIGCSFFTEKKNNLFYGVQGNYMFGNNVNDSAIFDNITTSTGAIIGADGTYADINLSQRGFDTYVFVGYAYHPEENNLSGFYLSGGLGFLQHQIFIDTKNQNIPQLNDKMKKGYDRLTNGISSKWETTYRYYDKGEKFQIYAGLNMTLAYTKIQREYLFDKMGYTPNTKSWDKLAGVKIGIIIPINRRNEEEFHYY